MLYRILTIIGGLVFVVALYALLWFFCRKFLEHHGVREKLSERASSLATWTFAGISVGLPLFIFGAFVLGPWAFYRTLRGHDMDISEGAAIWWGFGIVVAAMAITAAAFFGFLLAVGAY